MLSLAGQILGSEEVSTTNSPSEYRLSMGSKTRQMLQERKSQEKALTLNGTRPFALDE